MSDYCLKVRDANNLSVVLGQIAVSYEAAIGQRERVEFQYPDKVVIASGHMRGVQVVLRRFTLEVHRVSVGVYTEFCFKMTRLEWDDIKKKLGIER
jgi:hypothetical protein